MLYLVKKRGKLLLVKGREAAEQNVEDHSRLHKKKKISTLSFELRTGVSLYATAVAGYSSSRLLSRRRLLPPHSGVRPLPRLGACPD